MKNDNDVNKERKSDEDEQDWWGERGGGGGRVKNGAERDQSKRR